MKTQQPETEGIDAFQDAFAQLKAALETLPEVVKLPFEHTPEGQRLAKFRKICDPEFMRTIDRALLPSAEAFDRIADWSGAFPGPVATGPTNAAKTRAAWSALGKLYVKGNKAFAWFPARRLVGELAKYEEANIAEEFFRTYSFFPILFVDDLDKINWQFDSQSAAMFAFYDWVYRAKRPCITTTNKTRKWWADKMGDAFARRLFESSHFEVNFGN